MAPTNKKPTAEKTTGESTGDTRDARSKAEAAERQTAAVVRRARLEDEEWYVGMMGRDGIEPFLTTDGEFAVRASETRGKCELVLVVRAGARIHHVTIRWCPRNAHWTVLSGPDPKGFQSLAEMVAFYATNDLKLEGRKFRLQRPCAKPRWWVSRRDIAYSTRDKLGEGNFCAVYRGRWNRKDVAVKVCRDADGRKSDEDRQVAAARDTLLQEGKLMLEVRHVNVIQFYGMACEQPPVIVLLELCPGGSLLSLLRRWAPAISTPERVKFAVEAAEGMVYLHQK
ncbi:Tyrosine-protein kinase [Aphelenchoides fujianensis]|nr:Tyrosine-protein kinase [Aphelenchoides fujianensis]